jgi:hypothetical protein
MPLQNRVLPTGEIVADPHRGLMLGNRGCLHGSGRQLGVSRWRSKLWICCVLDWKGIRRDPMPPGRWTALFFLDEATALAAGHRPCGYCRRLEFLDFARAWQRAQDLTRRPLAVEMDRQLHAERVDRGRRQRTWLAPVATLPDGVLIRHDGVVSLLTGGQLLPWSLSGYGDPVAVDGRSAEAGGTGLDLAEVLTPPSTVAAIRAGYRPLVHPSSARAQSPGLRLSALAEPSRA